MQTAILMTLDGIFYTHLPVFCTPVSIMPGDACLPAEDGLLHLASPTWITKKDKSEPEPGWM
jgi:hypothetical protein